MNKLTKEQQFLLNLSCMVWARRKAAKSTGLSFNEETITETILLDLKTAYPGHVKIVAFNKQQEAKYGADWLWSFVNVDRSLSLPMLVQAKRLEDAEQIYQGINRNVGKRMPPIRQIDQILDTAKSHGVPAIYAFYNHVSDTNRVPQICSSLHPTSPDQAHSFGISLADASSVASVLPDEEFDTHKQHSIPLHCLLCSGGQATRPKGGTPELAASSLSRLRRLRAQEGFAPDDLGLLRGLHPIVELALKLAALHQDGRDIQPVDFLPGIAGVVVLQDSK